MGFSRLTTRSGWWEGTYFKVRERLTTWKDSAANREERLLSGH